MGPEYAEEHAAFGVKAGVGAPNRAPTNELYVERYAKSSGST